MGQTRAKLERQRRIPQPDLFCTILCACFYSCICYHIAMAHTNTLRFTREDLVPELQFYTSREIRKLFSISHTAFFRWIKRQGFPMTNINPDREGLPIYRISKRKLEEYLQRYNKGGDRL